MIRKFLFFLLMAAGFSMCTAEEKPGEVDNSADTNAAEEDSMMVSNKQIAMGARIFNRNCIVCHAPNKVLIGPAFQRVRKRRSPEWIKNMVRNPGGLMTEKDKTALCMMKEHNGVLMTPQNLTDAEITAVLDYVDSFPYNPEAQSDCE